MGFAKLDLPRFQLCLYQDSKYFQKRHLCRVLFCYTLPKLRRNSSSSVLQHDPKTIECFHENSTLILRRCEMILVLKNNSELN